jgi:hypothetical protein
MFNIQCSMFNAHLGPTAPKAKQAAALVQQPVVTSL